jgi:hypothetical protein
VYCGVLPLVTALLMVCLFARKEHVVTMHPWPELLAMVGVEGEEHDHNQPSGNQVKLLKKLVVELKDVAKTEQKNKGIVSKLIEIKSEKIKSEKKAETQYQCNKCDFVWSGGCRDLKRMIKKHICIKHFSDDFNDAMEEHFKNKTCTLLQCGTTLGSYGSMVSHLISKHKYFDGQIISDVNIILGNPVESEYEEKASEGPKRKRSMSSISQFLPKEKTSKLNDEG